MLTLTPGPQESATQEQINEVLQCIDAWAADGQVGAHGFSDLVAHLIEEIDWDAVPTAVIKSALSAVLTTAPATETAAVADRARAELAALACKSARVTRPLRGL